MNEKEFQKFMKRYDKFKKNNLPTLFYDEERRTREYVYKPEYKTWDGTAYHQDIKVFDNITEALSDVTYASFYYSYSCRFGLNENNEKVSLHTHAHSFDEVVRDLYDYPESFKISKAEEEFYSKQELGYLKRVQKYLLFIGMKDNDFKSKNTRYRNKLHKKYGHAIIHKYPKKTINDILLDKCNFRVTEWYDSSIYDKDIDPFDALIIDDDYDFRLYVKYVHWEVKKYKEIKDIYEIKNFKDNDNVVVTYFEILEKF